jgi:hypothetical protein
MDFDKNLTEEEIQQEEQKWAKDKQLLKRKIKIEKGKRKLNDKLKDKKELTTTKRLILFLFINCTLIEIFTGWATVKSLQIAAASEYLSPDFSPLVALIGAVVGEVIGFGVYSLKSVKENSKDGIVYESAMKGLNSVTSNDDGLGEDDDDSAVG